jgi:hypothetical protein
LSQLGQFPADGMSKMAAAGSLSHAALACL